MLALNSPVLPAPSAIALFTCAAWLGTVWFDNETSGEVVVEEIAPGINVVLGTNVMLVTSVVVELNVALVVAVIVLVGLVVVVLVGAAPLVGTVFVCEATTGEVAAGVGIDFADPADTTDRAVFIERFLIGARNFTFGLRSEATCLLRATELRIRVDVRAFEEALTGIALSSKRHAPRKIEGTG
jgi:hypothetical protein